MSSTARLNELGQNIGPAVDPQPRPRPIAKTLAGAWCDLVPLAASHRQALYEAFALDQEGRNWTYLPYGPFDSKSEFEQWALSCEKTTDPLFYSVVDCGQLPIGVLSLLAIDPSAASIEIGHVHFSPLLQQKTAATEAIHLLAQHVFGTLGYRRLEWKCDALNQPSRRAAERFGFCFEGIFRQHKIYKGRSRDTAWYSIVDHEWPQVETALRRWLAPTNFDSSGQQKVSLKELM